MSRPCRHPFSSHRYEYGRATVFVRRGSTLQIVDGMIPCTFKVQVHPVGYPIIEADIKAFYAWDAANRAARLCDNLREDRP